MLQGFTLGLSGMNSMIDKQNQIANNLANINTTGYKQSGLFTKAYQKYLADDKREPYVNRELKSDEVYIDFQEGPMKKTDNVLDVLIKGSGFFTIMAGNGIRYTRNGNFTLNEEGFLVTGTGSKVMGKNGFIKLDPKERISITNNGEILQKNDIQGELKITDFKKPYQLVREGDSNFKPLYPDNPGIESRGYVIKQGYLEGSNVSTIQNMVQMISSYRNMEIDQRAIQAQDQTLDKAVNSVGRVG